MTASPNPAPTPTGRSNRSITTGKTTTTAKAATFEEFAARLTRDTAAHRCKVIYLMPALATGAGVGLGLLLGPVWAIACLAAITGVARGRAWALRRRGHGYGVDWDTAAPYVRRLRSNLSTPQQALLAEVEERIRRRGLTPYPYRIGCTCQAGVGNGCLCPERHRAGIAPLPGGRAIIAVGDRLLEADIGELRFVLGHECGHLAGWRWWSQWAMVSVGSVGFVLAAIVTSGSGAATIAVTALALRVICTVWSWCNELACDAFAARRHGRHAPAYWARRAALARGRYALPWWQRPLHLAAQAMPAHPPTRLRAWCCSRVHRRALATAGAAAAES